MIDNIELENWNKKCADHVMPLAGTISLYFLKRGKRNINVIDVGSNIGEMIVSLEKCGLIVDDALLFEPVTDLLELSKIKTGNRFIYFNIGLSDKASTEFFYVQRTDNLGLGRIVPNKFDENVIEINVSKFDDLGLDFHADLIKIDVEGYDENVILGMEKYLEKTNHKPLIVFESVGIEQKSPEQREAFRYIQSKLQEIGYNGFNDPTGSCDIFVIPNE